MTTNRKTNGVGSGCFVLLAAVLLLMVVTVVVGGFIFSYAWNEFMTAAFALPEISLQEGIWGVVIMWLVAFIFRSSANVSRGGASK